MLTIRDISDWAEIQTALSAEAERRFEAAVMWAHYERRRLEIAAQIAGGTE